MRGRRRAPRRATSRAPASGSATEPSTGVTAKLLGGSHSSGSSAKTSTPEGSRPVSSSASRSAASRGVSPGSIVPPGNETWPGWERMWWARSVSSRSGPCSPSPKSISTAPRRGSASSGGMNRVRSWTVTARAPASSGRSHSGRSGVSGRVCSSVTAAPRGARRRGRPSPRPRKTTTEYWLDRAVVVDEDQHRHRDVGRERRLARQDVVGVGQQRARRRPRALVPARARRWSAGRGRRCRPAAPGRRSARRRPAGPASPRGRGRTSRPRG